LLTRVAALAKTMTNGEGDWVIQKVALIYAGAGQYDRAARMAEGLRDSRDDNFDRDETLKLIALELSRVGEYGRAVKLARRTDDYFRNQALITIAGTLLEAGRKGEALRLLSEVRRSASFSFEVEAGAAVIYARAGEGRTALKILDSAFEAAKEIGKFVDRDRALRQVAAAYSSIGSYDKALAAAQVEDYGYNKVGALAAVAVEMVKAGRDDEVTRAVEAVEALSPTSHVEANELSSVADEYLKAGKIEAAKAVLAKATGIARKAEVNELRPRALEGIAVKYAEAGDYEKAFEVAREIQSVFHKAFALADIGVLQAKAGVELSDKSESLLAEIVKGL
jgi:tetratricopeptide (TPR) repeat protein